MSTILAYYNNYGELITNSQALQLGNYQIEVFENDNKQKLETYRSGVLIKTAYYVSSEGEISTLLSANPNAAFTIQSTIGSYRIGESLDYDNGVLRLKAKIATDVALNKIICYQSFDVSSNMPIHSKTEKSYYDSSGVEIFSFSYNEDGTCFFIDKVQEYQTDFYADQIGVDPNIDFTWNDFEYYQFSEPLVPSSPIV